MRVPSRSRKTALFGKSASSTSPQMVCVSTKCPACTVAVSRAPITTGTSTRLPRRPPLPFSPREPAGGGPRTPRAPPPHPSRRTPPPPQAPHPTLLTEVADGGEPLILRGEDGPDSVLRISARRDGHEYVAGLS